MECEQCKYPLLEEEEHFVMCPSCGNILTQNLKGVEPKEFYYKTKNYKKLLISPFFLAVLWTCIPIRWMLKFDDNVYYTNLRNEFFFAPCTLFYGTFFALSVQTLESFQKYFKAPVRIFRSYLFMGIKTLIFLLALDVVVQYHTPRVIDRLEADPIDILFDMMDDKDPIFRENWEDEEGDTEQEKWNRHSEKIDREIDKRKPAVLEPKPKLYNRFLYINWGVYYALIWLNFFIYRRGIRINEFLLRNAAEDS